MLSPVNSDESTDTTNSNRPVHHPAAAATGKYCVQIIEEHSGKLLRTIMIIYSKWSKSHIII